MTPKERASQLWFELNIILPPLPSSWSADAVNVACQAIVVEAINRAINEVLEEAAAAVEALERGTYTSAQTPAGLVRAMKVK